MTRRDGSTLTPLVAGISCVSLIIVCHIAVLPSQIHYLRSACWVKTEGTVGHHHLTSLRDYDGGTSHHCHVSYWFIVDGKNFSGNRASLQGKMGSYLMCQMLSKMQPPKKRPVFYNPRRPAESSLELHMNFSYAAFGTLVHVPFFVLSLILLLGPVSLVMDETKAIIIWILSSVYSLSLGGLLMETSVEGIRRGDRPGTFCIITASIVIFLGVVFAGFFVLGLRARRFRGPAQGSARAL